LEQQIMQILLDIQTMQILLEDIFKLYVILIGFCLWYATTPTNLNLWHQYEDLIQTISLA
jgi:hypothetical protein